MTFLYNKSEDDTQLVYAPFPTIQSHAFIYNFILWLHARIRI